MTSALLGVLLLTLSAAPAPSTVAPCKRFDAARDLLKAGEPASALPIFRACLASAPGDAEVRWRALLGMALSNELSGRILPAVQYYRAFLEVSRKTSNSDWLTRRANAAREVERLEPTVLKTHALVQLTTTPSGARVTVDGRSPEIIGGPAAVTPFVTYVRSGPRSFQLNRDGHDALVRQIDAAVGQRYNVQVVLPKTPQVLPSPTVTTPPAMKTAAPNPGPWVLIGAGAAIAVAGAVSLAIMFDKVDQFEALVPISEQPEANVQARGLADDIRALNPAGVILLGAGVAALVGGIIWRVVDSEDAPSAGVNLSGGPQHVHTGIWARF